MSHWSSLRPIEIISSLHSSCTLLPCHHSTWQRDRAGKRRREDEQLLHCPPLVLWSIDSPGLYERVVILDIIKQVFISRRLGKRNSIKLQGLLSYWELGDIPVHCNCISGKYNLGCVEIALQHTVVVNFAGRGPTMGFGNGIQTLSKIDLDDPEKHWEKFHHTLKQYQVCFIYHLNLKTFKNVPISESGPIHRCWSVLCWWPCRFTTLVATSPTLPNRLESH